ncbi:MAG: HIT family protein [Ahrensia sp.]|nr:HIT family protein [Ahrensia sp.]
MDSSTCPFCAIVSGVAEANIVARFDSAIAFFPKSPASLGHTLVVPTDHFEDIWSLDVATASKLSEATLKLARAVKDAVAPEGLNIIQSNGEAATQTIPHLHIHVLPRWNGDGIGPIWPEDSAEDPGLLAHILARLRSTLGGRG